MSGRRLPTLFISHGSPMLAITDSPARRFLVELGKALPSPRAIVVFSAHHDAPDIEITSAAEPATIHDFGGFPAELYGLRYPAPGAPELAREVAVLLQRHSIRAHIEPNRGLDHGAWIPLGLMFPDADVPILQVSISSRRSPREHVAVGRALRVLRAAGVLLLGSGGATHNLGLYFAAREDGVPPAWVFAFAEWVAAAIAAGRVLDLERYRELAPYPAENHPTPEHFLPLFVVLGAAFDDERGVRIHSSYDRGVLALDAFAFGFEAWPGPKLPAATAAAAV
jgi:4,5-DOPA dioxygenase extradiol